MITTDSLDSWHWAHWAHWAHWLAGWHQTNSLPGRRGSRYSIAPMIYTIIIIIVIIISSIIIIIIAVVLPDPFTVATSESLSLSPLLCLGNFSFTITSCVVLLSLKNAANQLQDGGRIISIGSTAHRGTHCVRDTCVCVCVCVCGCCCLPQSHSILIIIIIIIIIIINE